MPEERNDGLTADGLLDGRVRLLQPARGYRVAIDAVLLAAAVPVLPGDTVLDVGTGVGAAALCLLARQPRARATGLEIQAGLADLARRNAVANGVAERFEIVEGDIAGPPATLPPASFDHVMTNPPFRQGDEGNPSPDSGKATATVEGPGGLASWMAFALSMARPGGTVAVIHEASRLGDVTAALAAAAGGIIVCPLWPAAGKPARRIVAVARKGGRTPLTLHPGLVLHGADGGFTLEAEGILRDAAGLDLGQSASRRRRPMNGAH
jgi:tRNA1(Val) A37 N6-methylase TrmN6